jgi:hypothetical protein
MFTSQPSTDDRGCACGRGPQETMVTSFRSISGTYLFHRCPCGIEWTERMAAPEQPPPSSGTVVREFHEHFHAFHGAMREEEAGRAHSPGRSVIPVRSHHPVESSHAAPE